MAKRKFKVDFDGNIAIGSIGETVESTLGNKIKFCRYRKNACTDTRGNSVDTLEIQIDGGTWDTLENGCFRRGEILRDFEIIPQGVDL